MRFFSTVAALLTLSLASSVIAAPTTLKTVERYRGAETSGKYIVKLKAGISRKGWVRKLRSSQSAVDWDIINGIAADLTEDELNTLRASDDVETVSEDVIMNVFATQTNAPWGLQRVSQPGRLTNDNVSALTFQYTYDDSAGHGVDIYVVDTGVLTTHTEFGGRARWGASFAGGTSDGHGHGTHCAGTAAGSRYGVAKKANIIAVQVFDASGSGSNSAVISGLNWVLAQARSSGRPSVASLSLGGAATTAMDDAVAALTAAGVHVVAAAGNWAIDADYVSPARAPSAITVGASMITDSMYNYSNYGAVIDVWAPGIGVISSWIGGNSATRMESGTSMAAPHVAGVVASLISKDGNISPAAMEAKIKRLSVKNVLRDIPSGTVNQLLQLQ